MGLREILTSPQSPWQDPYAERVIGSIRRECLNHLIVLNEGHLRRILREYVRYYNQSRPHFSLCRNSPQPRDVEPPSHGPVKGIPLLGGLHQHLVYLVGLECLSSGWRLCFPTHGCPCVGVHRVNSLDGIRSVRE